MQGHRTELHLFASSVEWQWLAGTFSWEGFSGQIQALRWNSAWLISDVFLGRGMVREVYSNEFHICHFCLGMLFLLQGHHHH